jgi:hypothetical protein
MTQYGTWIAYSGTARIALAAGLLAAGAGLAWASRRLPLPARLPRPGRTAVIVLVAAWVAGLAGFLASLAVYAQAALRDHIVPASDPITPVTILAAGVVFFIVLVTGSGAPRARLAGAVCAAIAGPMIFELPFDLIVMTRVYHPAGQDPAVRLTAFFATLFIVEITTLMLLSTSARVRLTRPAVLALGLMLIVFAAWAAGGFAYPAAGFPIAMNVLSKLLAFAVVLGLFLPGQARDRAGQEKLLAA